MSNWESKVWEYVTRENEYWVYRGKRYPTRDKAEEEQAKYEMAEQDHADNIRKGEE